MDRLWGVEGVGDHGVSEPAEELAAVSIPDQLAQSDRESVLFGDRSRLEPELRTGPQPDRDPCRKLALSLARTEIRGDPG